MSRLLWRWAVVGLCLVSSQAPAQRDTPCRERAADGPTAVIAGADEPGDRLVVEGRVVVGAEREAVAGARVLAYHTDAEGYYSDGGMDEANARLCGVARTDDAGGYRLETIRPAHYATGGPPAHVHFEVRLPDGRSERFTLHFEGDPELRGAPSGERWERVRPIETDAGSGQRVERDLWFR